MRRKRGFFGLKISSDYINRNYTTNSNIYQKSGYKSINVAKLQIKTI
mgnify:CR=1 FL=1